MAKRKSLSRARLTKAQAVSQIAKQIKRTVAETRKLAKGLPRGEAQRIAGLKQIRPAFFRAVDKVKVLDVQRRLNTPDLQTARDYYENIERLTKDRIHRFVFDSLDKPPSGVSKAIVKKHAELLTRGKNKGKFSIYFDNLYDLPISYQAAKRLRNDNRVARITNALLEKDWNDGAEGNRKFYKFIPARQRKAFIKQKLSERKLTHKIARQTAINISKSLQDQKVFDTFFESFGFSG